MRPVLLVLLVVVPLVELFVIIQVGQAIGPGWTVAALVAVSVAGAVLVKREGLRAWSRLREALGAGRLPAEEVTDGALLLLAGALLLAPGFVTDGVGLLLLLPPVRGALNRMLRNRVRGSVGLGRMGPGGPGRGARHRDVPPGDDLEVDVVDVRRTDDPPAGRDALGGG